ncbi:hypothetical protein [Caldisalinibacter kiritimatiensis]|uniref:Uncharacterized protein n=1 Tax=Caldisalinibacter kiritimatiensis TaxID=1304284 RepID=R1CB99_9FIRM|nr:hypothetical protein [Caldisalinibacter kiritimatiensis]EOC99584.1 hypothetical protein L21TH_2419 [Caldisalinibacter kiritimatiensis]
MKTRKVLLVLCIVSLLTVGLTSIASAEGAEDPWPWSIGTVEAE